MSDMDAGRTQTEADAKRDLVDLLLHAGLDGARHYAELAPDGRRLGKRERASAMLQLEAMAMCIVTAERERDLLRELTTVPATETLTLVRVMQQGLALALSESPELRARAVDKDTVLLYCRLAHEGWKSHISRFPDQP